MVTEIFKEPPNIVLLEIEFNHILPFIFGPLFLLGFIVILLL